MTGTISPSSNATAIPRFTSSWKRISSPSREALMTGWSWSAATVASATKAR
jgi:hypothetical protein